MSTTLDDATKTPRERGLLFADGLHLSPVRSSLLFLSFLQHPQLSVGLPQSQSNRVGQAGKDLHAELRMRP